MDEANVLQTGSTATDSYHAIHATNVEKGNGITITQAKS